MLKFKNVGKIGLRVRPQPSLEAHVLDHVFDGDVGVILEEVPDHEEADNRFTWWMIEWDNGKLGWSAEAGLDGTVYLVKAD